MPPAIPPSVKDHLEDVAREIRTPRPGLVLDFDGTLSEIALTPDAAVIYPGVLPPLRSLVKKLALVSVVSGRAARNLEERVGIEGIAYAGNHGAEYLYNGVLDIEPATADYRDSLESVMEYLRSHAALPGMVWDDKGLSASVHYRQAQDHREARRRLEAALESAPGMERLEVFWGRLVLEIRAPTGLTKGFALRKLVREWRLESVVFVGDDTTDVDAMRALREMKSGGEIRGAGIVVASDETPEALLEQADYSLNSVSQVAEFLSWLDDLAG